MAWQQIAWLYATYIRVNSTARLRGFCLLLRRFEESIRMTSDSFPWNFPSPFLQTLIVKLSDFYAQFQHLKFSKRYGNV